MVCILDWIIGSLRYCLADKSISSRFVFRKAGEKLMIFVLVGIANVLDSEILGAGQVLRDAVIFFYISGEVVAI